MGRRVKSPPHQARSSPPPPLGDESDVGSLLQNPLSPLHTPFPTPHSDLNPSICYSMLPFRTYGGVEAALHLNVVLVDLIVGRNTKIRVGRQDNRVQVDLTKVCKRNHVEKCTKRRKACGVHTIL